MAKLFLIVDGDYSDYKVISGWTDESLAKDEVIRLQALVPGSEIRLETYLLNGQVSPADLLWRTFELEPARDFRGDSA